MPTTNITFGRVPYPSVVTSPLPFSNPYIKDGALAVPEAVFWHRMIGTWNGTDGWFHAGNAATAYGVAVAATDGAETAGKIYEWISRESGWYGESSGPAKNPYGDGALLIAKVGVDRVNQSSRAIEISGEYDTPLDEAARASIAAITAYWADVKQIPWDVFPIVPGESRSFVCWHNEITGTSYKLCPGAVVMQETPALIQRVKALLKQYQTDAKPTKPPVYAPPVLPPWFAESLERDHPSDAVWNERRYWAMRRNGEAVASTNRLAEPRRDAPPSGPKVAVREKVFIERSVPGNDGKTYWLTQDGHYVLAAKFTPNVTIRTR